MRIAGSLSTPTRTTTRNSQSMVRSYRNTLARSRGGNRTRGYRCAGSSSTAWGMMCAICTVAARPTHQGNLGKLPPLLRLAKVYRQVLNISTLMRPTADAGENRI